MLNIIRSDRGRETLLTAAAHFFLSQGRNRIFEGVREEVKFHDCWVYGKSIHNEKIESWWGRLATGSAAFWRASIRNNPILFDSN